MESKHFLIIIVSVIVCNTLIILSSGNKSRNKSPLIDNYILLPKFRNDSTFITKEGDTININKLLKQFKQYEN